MSSNHERQNKQTTFIKDLFDRRVPQIMGVYLGTSWVVIEFADWLANRYVLSPHLVDLILVALLSMVPTVLIIAYFHGRPGRDKWTKIEKFGIPVNLVFTVALILVLFSGRELGAASDSVTLKDEEGNSIERVIPKSEFRKKIAFFFFENESGDSTLNWLQYGLPFISSYDLLQDIFLETRDGYELYDKVKQEGFSEADHLPLTLKLKIANSVHMNFILSGSIKKQDDDFLIKTSLHEIRRGKLIAENTFQGTDIFQLADEISLKLKYDLELPSRHIEDAKDLPISELTTSSVPALRAFIEGMNESEFYNDYKRASAHLEQSIREDSLFALAHIQLFVVYANANETEKSRDPLQAAMQYIYKFPERLQFEIKAIHYLVNEEKDKRLAVLKMWTELYPEDLAAHKELAGFYHSAGQLDEAISQYKQILEIDTEQYRYLHTIGDLYAQKQNYGQALKYYEQYAKNFPNEPLSFTKLGELYETKGDYEEAKSNYEKALLIDPEEIASIIKLGDIERKLGNFDRALEQYQMALENSKSPEQRSKVYNSLEEYYELRGQINKSIEYLHLKWAEQEKFRSPLGFQINKLFDLSQYVKAGKEDIAFQTIKTIKLYSPFDKAISLGYLLIYMELEDADNIEQALVEAEQTVEALGFGDAEAIIYAGQGLLHRRRGEYGLAIQSYEKALAIEPTRHALTTSIGKAYRYLKEYDKARSALIKVLKILPFDPEAHYELALVFQEIGEKERALEHLNKALYIWEEADPEYMPAKQAREKLAEWKSVS